MPHSLEGMEQLLYSTVRIECDLRSGELAVGTGFRFRFETTETRYIPILVTNAHVIKDAVKGRLALHKATESGDLEQNGRLDLEFLDFERLWLLHPDPDVDLAVLGLGMILEAIRGSGKRVFGMDLHKGLIPSADQLDEIDAIEDVIMVGYPSGIWDEVNATPIVQRGITATPYKLDHNGRREFVIDIPCFDGSSGSPVFLYNSSGYTTRKNVMNFKRRCLLLGVYYAGYEQTIEGTIRSADLSTAAREMSVATKQNVLGLVIKTDRILEFEPLIREKLGMTNHTQ